MQDPCCYPPTHCPVVGLAGMTEKGWPLQEAHSDLTLGLVPAKWLSQHLGLARLYVPGTA